MPEAKKTNTLIEKTIPVLKTIQKHMKKRHSTALQTAWSKKNKHSHWKNNAGLKNLLNSNEKTAQPRLTKCLKPKKQTLSLKKQFWSWKPNITYSDYVEYGIGNLTIFRAFKNWEKTTYIEYQKNT